MKLGQRAKTRLAASGTRAARRFGTSLSAAPLTLSKKKTSPCVNFLLTFSLGVAWEAGWVSPVAL
jgi:hypothetical protein